MALDGVAKGTCAKSFERYGKGQNFPRISILRVQEIYTQDFQSFTSLNLFVSIYSVRDRC